MRGNVLLALLVSPVLLALSACSDNSAPLQPSRAPTPGSHRDAVAASSFKDITSGDKFSCGLRVDGTVKCWGANDLGQLVPRGGTFKRIEAGVFASFACGIRTDDTLACWGTTTTEVGVTHPPAGTYKDVSSGLQHACAVATDGSVKCWGGNPNGQTEAPAGNDFVQVAAGFEYSCGLKTNGTIVCWGMKGVGGAGQTNVPTALGPFTAVSASFASTCAIRSTGALVCWGRPFGTESSPPQSGTWHALRGGSTGGCAINQDNQAACWSSKTEPTVVPAGSYVAVDEGSDHACAITSAGAIACWGNSANPATDPTQDSQATIVWQQGGTTVSSFTAFATAPVVLAAQAVDPDDASLNWTYSWTVNDSHDPVSGAGGATLTHTFAAAGTYAVSVAASDGAGHTITRSTNVVVSNFPLTAEFSAPDSVRLGRTYTLAISNVQWAGTNGGDYTYRFGCLSRFPGASSATPSFQCAAQSTPRVITTSGNVRNSVVASVTYSKIVIIADLAPTATFTAPASVDEGTPIQLSLSDIDDENVSTSQWAFDCGAGFGPMGTATSASCPTTDNGTVTVRAKLQDATAHTREYSRTVQVLNVAPAVSALAAASIMAGETYSASGTFTDPGADTWTATVNYGAGAQPLTLTNKTFSLQRTFTTAGTYGIVVTVTDDDGGQGSSSATVIVLNGAQAAAALTTTLQALQTSGELDAAAVSELSTTLANAADQFAKGNTTPAVNQVRAFINKVNALENSRRLTSGSAKSLTDYANRIIASMQR